MNEVWETLLSTFKVGLSGFSDLISWVGGIGVIS